MFHDSNTQQTQNWLNAYKPVKLLKVVNGLSSIYFPSTSALRDSTSHTMSGHRIWADVHGHCDGCLQQTSWPYWCTWPSSFPDFVATQDDSCQSQLLLCVFFFNMKASKKITRGGHTLLDVLGAASQKLPNKKKKIWQKSGRKRKHNARSKRQK